MKEENRCFTYFMIRGNFDPTDITTILGLSPSTQWRIGDTRKNGTKFDFALWEYGRCNDYDAHHRKISAKNPRAKGNKTKVRCGIYA